MPINISKLAYDSPTYPTDLIVTQTPYTGSFTCTGYNGGTLTPGTGSTTITHNLNKKCYPELLWSTDNANFVPAPQENVNRLGVVAACSTNTCTIYAYQAVGTSSVTVYYKLYLLWPN